MLLPCRFCKCILTKGGQIEYNGNMLILLLGLWHVAGEQGEIG